MVTLSQLHSRIYNDAEWRYWSEMVNDYTGEEDKKFGCDHGMSHWLSVAHIASDFVSQAGGNQTEIYLADIAGMLHDCGLICGDANHAYNGAQIARAYLESHFGNNRPLNHVDIGIITHAIAQHSNGDKIKNLIDAAVLFADKIDIDRHRLKSEPLNDVQCEVQKIQRIEYLIKPYCLALRYHTEGDFSFERLCWPKAYQIPAKVANYLGKPLWLFVNDQRISLPL